MAIETVSFPGWNGDFPVRYVNAYQWVYSHKIPMKPPPPINHHFSYGLLYQRVCSPSLFSTAHIITDPGAQLRPLAAHRSKNRPATGHFSARTAATGAGHAKRAELPASGEDRAWVSIGKSCALIISHSHSLKMAIEMTWVFRLKIVIFHSYVNVYQRVSSKAINIMKKHMIWHDVLSKTKT